ncbi:DBB domain-containing protein stumps isoform X1 [Rhodnius prolixus]|uniref:DBB domain-containing protein stumps isoform X1 n=2 Tax=Rhodnius prolixus TaxID=13249 RepID=UPI003D18CDD3
MEALDNPSYFRLSSKKASNVLQGAPRARDIAPPDEHAWRQQRRASDHQESVLLGPTSARYYNLAAAPIKRHSLTTLQRSRSLPTGKPSSTMLDIVIVSSKESTTATLWVNYLSSCFQQISREEKREPFKLSEVSAEDVLGGLPVEGAAGSKLQIVIICPVLLELLTSSPGVPILASLLQPTTVLAMLLGVTPQALDTHHLASLFRFSEWRRLTVKDQDPMFVGDLLGVAMDILSRTWQLKQAIQQINTDANKAHFSIVPKKIKVGQNKVLILLNEPIGSHDKVSITVDRSGNKLDITSIKRRNPYTLQFTMPSSCLQTSMLVTVNVDKNGRSLGQRLVKCECRMRELDQLLRSVDNPLLFMCQALGLTSGEKEQLDACLVAALQKNMPPNFNILNAHVSRQFSSKEEFPTLLHFAARYGLEKLCWQLLECPGGETACQIRNGNNQTPAEIAERSGHSNLAHALQGYLQMTELSSMYTYLKKVAEKRQGDLMSDANYLLPRPLSDTYLVPPRARPVLAPLPLQTEPLVQPSSSAPSSPIESYQSPPQARPFTPATPGTPSSPASPLDKAFSHYLHMHSPVSDSSSNNFDQILGPEKKYTSNHPSIENLSINSNGGHHYMNTSCSSSVCSKSPEDELVEIINDFKNNVFTISEVEKLVEAWRNRNDVQQSFREKQEQLNQMRQEYERIQQSMKEQMKRSTPFERIKKFFTRKPKNGEVGDKSRPGSDAVCHRPVSSLSLHSSCSSSSSGRMSTASGTSLGDSGTHSDPDEKKTEILAFDKITTIGDNVFHERLQSVKEQEPYNNDEYVKAAPTTRYALPQPPPLIRRSAHKTAHKTVVEVHRADRIDLKPLNGIGKVEQSTTVLAEVHKPPGEKKNVEKIKEENNNDLNRPEIEIKEEEINVESIKKDIEILGQSERLLEDMASPDPSNEHNDEKVDAQDDDDLLSPTEEEFTIVETTQIKDENSDGVLRNNPDYMNLDVKNHTLDLDDIQMADISMVPEYVNVTLYPSPPIPPRSRYKNVLL